MDLHHDPNRPLNHPHPHPHPHPTPTMPNTDTIHLLQSIILSARTMHAPAVPTKTPASELLPNPTGVWLVGLDRSSGKLRSYTGEAYLVSYCGAHPLEILEGPVAWSSHPGQTATKATGTPDVDGDGVRDIAYTIPGVAYPQRGKRNASGRFDPATSRQPVYRDTTGKGGIDNARASGIVYAATAIQYHAGGTSGPVSIGCWTSPPKDFARMAKAIEKHAPHGFRVVFALDRGV